MSASKESSGVRTCTAPSVSSQPRVTAASASSAAPGLAWRATSSPPSAFASFSSVESVGSCRPISSRAM